MRIQNSSIMLPLSARPEAFAQIIGDAAHPMLSGRANFYSHQSGTVMLIEIWGLPYSSLPCAENICAMHIHEAGDCSDKASFMRSGGHFDPYNCPHPAHAGDLPPLFSNGGYAWQGFYTDRFIPLEVVGKSLIIHSQRDDFTSQPAGDAGERIGCGVIKAWRQS